MNRIAIALLVCILFSVGAGFACTATGGSCSVNSDCCSKLCVSGTCVGSDRHIVYAEDYASCSSPPCDGEESDPWTSGSGTGGIQEALDACVSSNAGVIAQRDGCTVILPKGYVAVTETIFVNMNNGSTGSPQDGLVMRGHGSGQKSSSTPTFAGTTLVWQGGNGGTVLVVAYTSWSKFEDFSIDGGGTGSGGGTAGVGIHLTAAAPDGDIQNGPTQKNIFRNIYISSINNADGPVGSNYGIGIRIGPETPDYQISENSFEDIVILGSLKGVVQEGSQSVNNVFKRVDVYNYAEYGMDFKKGNVLLEACTFISDPESAAVADVHLANDAELINAVFDSNYHESKMGAAYLFDQGTNRTASTTFVNTRVHWFQNQGDCDSSTDEPPNRCPRVIDYRQTGTISLIGCEFNIASTTANGLVDIDVPSGGGPGMVASYGNAWPSNSSGGGVKMRLNGNATLSSNDNPTHIGGVTYPEIVSNPHLFHLAGLVMEDSTLNWKTSSSTIAFRQELNSNQLRLIDPNFNILNWWDANGGLTFNTTLATLAFKNTVLAASSPSTTASVTVPSVTDTLVGRATSDTLTNKTYDVEATGNEFTTVEKRAFPVGACMLGTARPAWNAPSQAAFSITCAGSNTVRMVESYADGAAAYSIFQTVLPTDWTGSIDLTLRWFANTTSNSVVWQVATACATDGADYDPSFNSYQTVTDTSKGTANQLNDATIAGLTTTGCSAGSTLFVKVYRDPAHASDTLGATAFLLSAELVLRRTM